MPNTTPLLAAVFDYGGVLTTPVSAGIQRWIERDGIDPQSFSAVLKRWLSRDAQFGTPIHRLELGQLSSTEFDDLLRAELVSLDGSPVRTESPLTAMFAGVGLDPAMVELLADLRAAGIRTAMLSNSWGKSYPMEVLGPLFDVVVISGHEGLRKPDRAIYELTLDRLGLSAEEAVFIDDSDVNTTGAITVGMQAIVHRTPAETRSALGALLASKTFR